MYEDAHDVAMSVAKLNRRLRRERRSALTPTQLSILSTVNRVEPATPGAIAADEGVKPPSVTRILNQLADSGYITRLSHPDDGRQVLVKISEEGRNRLAEERRRRDAWLQEQLHDLNEEERELLRHTAPILIRLAEGV